MNKFPMHDAAACGDLEKVRQLIEAGVSVDSLNGHGQTPLHTAAFYGQYEVAALLINSNCDLDIKDRDGCTPMMLAAKRCKYRSLRPRRMIAIVHLLLHRGAEVSCVDNYGRTLLHHACENGLTEAVRLILDSGEADLNASSRSGKTPLLCAVLRGEFEIAALLIRAGADVNRSDALMKRTVLHLAVSLNCTRVFQVLLEKEGLDLSPQDVDGNTPLHLACRWGYREVVEQLLDAGASTNLKNSNTGTALCVGIKHAMLTIEEIRLFLQKGAFLEKTSYNVILCNSSLREVFLKDVEFCTQSIVNKFHHQSLPALNSITYFARRLPNVDSFKLTARQIDEVKNLVKSEIERNTWCNVVEVHPISLSALCVLSLL